LREAEQERESAKKVTSQLEAAEIKIGELEKRLQVAGGDDEVAAGIIPSFLHSQF
jgi:hypothetical protein